MYAHTHTHTFAHNHTHNHTHTHTHTHTHSVGVLGTVFTAARGSFFETRLVSCGLVVVLDEEEAKQELNMS